MVWFTWLIAVAGFAGGSWVIYRKFVAPEQSMWEGLGDWFSSKNPLKAKERKEGKVDKTRADLLQELNKLHQEDDQFNVMINLLKKSDLTIDECRQLKQVVENEQKLLFDEFKFIADASKNMNTASKLIERENSRIEKGTSEEIRRDWQKEFMLIKEIFSDIGKIKEVIKRALDIVNELNRGIGELINTAISKKEDKVGVRILDKTVDELINAKNLRNNIIPSIQKKVEEVKQVLDQEKIDLSTANVTAEPQQKA